MQAVKKVSALDLDLITFWCTLTHVAICLLVLGIKYTACQFKTCIFPSASVTLSGRARSPYSEMNSKS